MLERTTVKKCSICSEIVEHSAIQCPKCGRGLFEALKRDTADKETNTEYSGFPEAVDSSDKNIYWGPTKLELLCISIQVFDREHYEALDTGIMMNVVNQIIPDIKSCRLRDIRLSHAINQKTAFANASKLLNEVPLSDGSLMYGEMGVSLDGIAVYFALSIVVAGGKKNLVTIMKKSTQWSANLKVK